MYSFIIPVFNRPDEIKELMESISSLQGNIPFEVIIVEDGSSIPCKEVVDQFKTIDITYYFKPNSGPGNSRNYGMERANGDYFIILDSDCILPPQYLINVNESLKRDYVDCFGGPDAAHPSFTSIQKGINFAMTSTLSTGGVRGKEFSKKKFEPRSFNMGLSKLAFKESNGFGNIHPGEDPDLSLRLLKKGFELKFVPEAFVFHKRRISWPKFIKQVYKFGLVRPILNKWHPNSKKKVFWLPSIFLVGSLFAVFFAIIGNLVPLIILLSYLLVIFVSALINEKSFVVAIQAVLAVLFQLYGYGYGFLKSTILITLLGKKPQVIYPSLFFKNGQ